MAGAGFKTFSAGDILSSSDVNSYLMQQTVTVFADSTARDSAISSPTEGMICYLKDSDRLFTYTTSSPSGWRPITPFTMEMGTQSITGSGTINFTSGRFTTTPVILVSVASAANTATSVTYATNTNVGITAYVWTGTTAASVGRNVHWLAIQATSSSGTG
jgi:hypothetical protein